MYPRFIGPSIQEALKDTPVVLIEGARQVGKSTLAKELTASTGANYYTLDDSSTYSAITSDPDGFIRGLNNQAVVIDEVQRAPKLFTAIKAAVDRDRTPGRFLLTGSANIMLLPKISESLAGRIEIARLFPLSECEIRYQGINDTFIDNMFSIGGNWWFEENETGTRQKIIERIVEGGYPEPLGRTTETHKRAWFDNYITTILQRDVRDIINIQGLQELPKLFQLRFFRLMTIRN